MVVGALKTVSQEATEPIVPHLALQRLAVAVAVLVELLAEMAFPVAPAVVLAPAAAVRERVELVPAARAIAAVMLSSPATMVTEVAVAVKVLQVLML